MSEIYIELLHEKGHSSRIGTWEIPDNRVSNFRAQEDLGWHIMLAFVNGAKEVSVKLVKEEKP